MASLGRHGRRCWTTRPRTPGGGAPRLADAPRPGAGSATLVLRTQRYPHAAATTGADLYTDSGKYFYATTESGLPSAIAQDANEGGFVKRELAVASFAANGNLATARERMAVAGFTPGFRLRPPRVTRAMVARGARGPTASRRSRSPPPPPRYPPTTRSSS
jgi:hypothetical protein